MISTLELLQRARRNHSALACVSVYNLESIQAVVAAAESRQQPVMLSIGNEAIAHAGLEALGNAALHAARQASTPVVVHLNHGRSLDRILQALDLGFGSVMFDGSNLPFCENLQHTRRAVQLAHEAGAAIEGELGPLNGPIGGVQEQDVPELAHAFAQETQVDVLALSIASDLDDLDVLRSLSLSLPIPLAIHGASRLGPDGASLVSSMGAHKINFHSEIKRAMQQGGKEALNRGCAALEVLDWQRETVKRTVQQKLVDISAMVS